MRLGISFCTTSTSCWCFRSTFNVSFAKSSFNSLAFSNIRVLAQSIVSLIAGNFFKSKSLSPWTKLTSCIFRFSLISGTLAWIISLSSEASGKGIYKCKHLLLSASPISLLLLLVKITNGFTCAFLIPNSGIETWNSDKISNNSASNSSSDLSTSSISKTFPLSEVNAWSKGLDSKKSSEKNIF